MSYIATRITDANPQLADLQLATMRLLTWASTDGTVIEDWKFELVTDEVNVGEAAKEPSTEGKGCG